MPHIGSGRTDLWGVSVYGREPSFPNPTANLVSTKRGITLLLRAFLRSFLCCLVFEAALLVFLSII